LENNFFITKVNRTVQSLTYSTQLNLPMLIIATLTGHLYIFVSRTVTEIHYTITIDLQNNEIITKNSLKYRRQMSTY
jgi:hypothetical protein